MDVLGIDPGLVRTGWALIQPVGGRAVVQAYGLIAPATERPLPERLADGARQLRAVLAQHRPDLVALEEVFTATRHPRSALLMAHMRGVICLVVAEAGVPILPLTATTVKQRLTGSGHASKQQVQRMVLRLTDLEGQAPPRLDVTDAMALAIAGVHQALYGVSEQQAGGSARHDSSLRAAHSRADVAARLAALAAAQDGERPASRHV